MQQHNTLLCTCWNANYNNCSQGFIYKPRFILGGDTKLLTLIKASESFKHNLVIINFAIVKSLIVVTCSHPLSPYCHIYFFCLDQNDFAENFCSTGTKCPEPCKCSHGESRTKTRVRCDHNKNNKTMNKVKQLLVLIEYSPLLCSRRGGLPWPGPDPGAPGHPSWHCRAVSHRGWKTSGLTNKNIFRRLENNQITEIGPHAFQSAVKLKRMWVRNERSITLDQREQISAARYWCWNYSNFVLLPETCHGTDWGMSPPGPSSTTSSSQHCKCSSTTIIKDLVSLSVCLLGVR